MRQLSDLTEIVHAINTGFPSSRGQAELIILLAELNINFDDFVEHGAVFEITLLKILMQLNSQDGGLKKLLQKLVDMKPPRPAIMRTVPQFISSEQTGAQRSGHDVLADAKLLIGGDPFVDRHHLRDNILPNLLKNNAFPRAVVITGPSHSGKTFSMKLLRCCCQLLPDRIVPFDISARPDIRDSLAFARWVNRRIGFQGVQLPEANTGEATLSRLIVDEMVAAQVWLPRIDPMVLVFDHLDKNVAPDILDFTEQLALAAASDRLQSMKVFLIGFPRAPTGFPDGKVLQELVSQPGPAEVAKYLDDVLDVLERDVEDGTLTTLINEMFQNQEAPFTRDFMDSLPWRVRGIVDKFVEAPQS